MATVCIRSESAPCGEEIEVLQKHSAQKDLSVAIKAHFDFQHGARIKYGYTAAKFLEGVHKQRSFRSFIVACKILEGVCPRCCCDDNEETSHGGAENQRLGVAKRGDGS